MKRWKIILVAALALLLVALTPITALAQTEEETAAGAGLKWKGALAIVAPWLGAAGKEVSMTIFLRENQEPFPGAGVWVMTKEEAEALRTEAKELNEEGAIPAEEKDYEALAESHGELIGRTNGNGKLIYTFGQAGRYVLVAAKRGYIPGFTHIAIHQPIKALTIRANPPRVQVGNDVTMTVNLRGSNDGVEVANIWAITRDEIEALKGEVASMREDQSISAAEKDYEGVVSAHGTLLGNTDADGKFTTSFSEAGGNVLVAVKKGYIPGFTVLRVREVPEPKPTTQRQQQTTVRPNKTVSA